MATMEETLTLLLEEKNLKRKHRKRAPKSYWCGWLNKFQEDIIHAIFDPMQPDGRRKVREALLMIPRKNGKTALSAGLSLYALYDGEQSGQVVVAANSRDQASLLFNAAADAVEQDPVLRGRSIDGFMS
jgi:phage terminase large subunit-like protein